MELNEFQGLALRTESRISNINVDQKSIISLLKMTVALTEILDGVKKAVFYNKTSKLQENFFSNLDVILDEARELDLDFSALGVEAVINSNTHYDNIDPRVFHGILGIVTESGELASALLKCFENSGTTIDPVNVQEEMSDIGWYEAILHDTLKLDWGQGLENVINKLRVRYPDKYSDEAAENRNLEAERAELEKGVSLPVTPSTMGTGDVDVDYFQNLIWKGYQINVDFPQLQHDFVTGKYRPDFDANGPCTICGDESLSRCGKGE